ncbi:MAG: hypothetical protein WA633_29370 [Stellaceae bacterium]
MVQFGQALIEASYGIEEARALVNRAESLKLAMREFTGLARGALQSEPAKRSRAEIVEAIICGDIELGLVEASGEEFGDPHLAVEMIAQDDLMMVVSANHPWVTRKELTGDDLTAGN